MGGKDGEEERKELGRTKTLSRGQYHLAKMRLYIWLIVFYENLLFYFQLWFVVLSVNPWNGPTSTHAKDSNADNKNYFFSFQNFQLSSLSPFSG